MVFYFLIFIVFIAELIITTAIIIHLFKLDRAFIEYNIIIDNLKPDVSEIICTCRKISEQLVELSNEFVKKCKEIFINILSTQLKNALAGFTFWLVKKEVEKHVH